PLRHPASSKVCAATAGGPPVFVNSRSTPPKVSTVALCHRPIASASLRSAACARTRTPLSFLVFSPAADTASRPRDAIDTWAPSSASARATAKPRPLLAPPTIAVLPLRLRSISIQVRSGRLKPDPTYGRDPFHEAIERIARR